MINRFAELEQAMVEYLVNECGKDPRQDAEYSGYIKAIRDFRHTSLEEIKET